MADAKATMPNRNSHRRTACGRVSVAPSDALRVFSPRARWPSDARMSGFVHVQMK